MLDGSEKNTKEITNADPYTAYKNTEGEWRDTDKDNIPDVIESDPERMHLDRFDDMPWIESMRRFEEEFNVNDDEKERIYEETLDILGIGSGKRSLVRPQLLRMRRQI